MEDGTEEKLFFVAEMEDRSKLLSFLPFLKTEHLNCQILPLYHLIVIAMMLLLLKHCPLEWTHSAIIALHAVPLRSLEQRDGLDCDVKILLVA